MSFTSPSDLRGVGGYSRHLRQHSTGQLERQNVRLLDDGRLYKKLLGSRLERRGDFTREVRPPALLVREGVEDCVGRRAEADGKPADRIRLLLDQLQSAAEKG